MAVKVARLHAPLVWRSEPVCQLGECPIWDEERSVLHWIDVSSPGVLSWNATSGESHRTDLSRPPGSIFLSRQGRVLVALRRSLGWLQDGTAELLPVSGVAPPTEREGFNDGRCDANGTLWIGTLDRKMQAGIGSIVGIRDARTIQVEATGAVVGNGMCFSPDGRHAYFSDSVRREILRYELRDGELRARTSIATLDAAPGKPDGCSVDAEGCLWSARVGGGRIDRYAPDGRLVGVLDVPLQYPTHCAFGGPDLATLFVTSLRAKDELAASPDAGRVLAFDLRGLGVRGLREHRVSVEANPDDLDAATRTREM